jgi:hypothetical protein
MAFTINIKQLIRLVNMDIGEEQETIRVEPLEDPVKRPPSGPGRELEPAPEPAPDREPVPA